MSAVKKGQDAEYIYYPLKTRVAVNDLLFNHFARRDQRCRNV